MSARHSYKVDLLAETSWEVCNKIGGIYTVLSTKAIELKKLYGDSLVFIGPDFKDRESNSLFVETPGILNDFARETLKWGITVRCGKWNIPGSPAVVLVDFTPVFNHLNSIYGEMWDAFHVDSLHAYGDYDESCAFSVAAAIVIMALARHIGADPAKTIGHFDEWTTGMGLLYLKKYMPEAATVFTTHATTIGRSICGNGKPLYQYFTAYNGDQMASELNVESKHSLEKAAAHNADCFTTVSQVTARECEQLLDICPAVVTPNGFEPEFVPGDEEWESLRASGREKVIRISSMLAGRKIQEDCFIVATSGRNEYRNKGLDLFIDSMVRLAEKSKGAREIIALILVPAWVKQPSGDLIIDLDFGGWIKPDPDYLTHRLNNEESDSIACRLRDVSRRLEAEGLGKKLKFVFVPSYLDGCDGIINISYYDLLPAVDISAFCSYYEPWGYTPLESVAFGVPTITTDKAGFGQWAAGAGRDSLSKGGVVVVNREDTNYNDNVESISDALNLYMGAGKADIKEVRRAAKATASKAEWKFFISKYKEAYKIALDNSKQHKDINK